MFQAAAGGSPVVDHDGADPIGGGAPAGRPAPRPQHGWVATTESGERRTLDEIDQAAAAAPEVRRMAEAIARRLSVRRRPPDRLPVRGSGPLVSVPYRYGSDDIDLDRTLEVLTERPVPEDTDIVVREGMRSRRAVALVVDVSGSMRGDKVAFWKHAVVVKPLARVRPATQVLRDLLRLPARGLTNVGFALGVALDELTRSRARRRSAILLSDAVHNAGPDPRGPASRFGRLDVLLEVGGEHDGELAADLARAGHGQLVPIRHHRDVAPALNRLLAR